MAPNDNAEIAARWRRECVSADLWFKSENQAGCLPSSADGCYLESESIGWRRAYGKPLRPGQMPRGRAAREKLAADLANELGVGVPPCLLVERRDAGRTLARFVNVSLVMYPGQAPWWAVRRSLADSGPSALRTLARRTLAADAARAFVFDTWVGQTEHHPQHPHNIVLGWRQSIESSFAFLDYEYAFAGIGRTWQGERWREISAAPFPSELLEAMDATEAVQTASRIASLPDRTIAALVTRIPSEFLDEEDGQEIIAGLLGRKSLVQPIVKSIVTSREAR